MRVIYPEGWGRSVGLFCPDEGRVVGLVCPEKGDRSVGLVWPWGPGR
ncbi:hypothetical protein [Actinoplanes sp. CA-252034]